jgi:hypothetical protein
MKRLLVGAVAAAALAVAGTAGAALMPWTFNGPGVTCPVVSTLQGGVLHLEKNCTTPTNASAGASISGFTGATFSSASFILANTSQCQGGSPRFNVVTTTGTFFLGCNNVTPSLNPGNGNATYNFSAETIAAAGNQVPVPTGTIKSVDVLIDVQGSADLTDVIFNGVLQSSPSSKEQCKHGGWMSSMSPGFKNQGQCVSHFVHQDGKHKNDH